MKLTIVIIIASVQLVGWWFIFHLLHPLAKSTGTDMGLSLACAIGAIGCAAGIIQKYLPKT